MKRFLTIRVKLAFVSLLLLVIPVSGFWYGARMKSYLMAGQEQALALTARAVATILHDHPELFEGSVLHSYDREKEIHAYLLPNKIHLDGSYEEWSPLLAKAKNYDSGTILESTGVHENESLNFKHVIGRDDNYYYALFIVTDDTVIHREPNKVWLNKSDHLQIALADNYGRLNRYFLSAKGSGWVNAHLMPADQYNFMPVRFEPDIEGYWRDTIEGYVLELRLPRAMVKQNRISFAIADVDDRQTLQVATVIGTSGTRQSSDLGFLLTRSPELESILKALDKPQARISIVDARKRLRASVGTYYGEPDEFRTKADSRKLTLNNLIRPVVRLFAESYAEVFSENPDYMEEYQVAMLQTALNGQPFITRKHLADKNVEVLVAGEPLRSGSQVMGAVIVEQPTNSILSMKNRIVEDTIKITLVVFLVGTLALLFFATRLSGRIRKLMLQTDNAMGADGIIRKTFRPSGDQDELGDLSRRFAAMLTRLRDYNLYQEKMADNLEHEVRTPVAGISAALINLEKKLKPEDEELGNHLAGMHENIKRIERIMTSIREATTLDEALQQSEQTSFDLAASLRAWVEQGYALTFPDRFFNLQTPDYQVSITGDPIRIRQMLDKIFENAIDFSPDASSIDIHLSATGRQAGIRIANEGPPLPKQMQDHIFHSMVSVRRKKGTEAHLGLGLYVARKIAEFHTGSIGAKNRDDGIPGVELLITLPVMEETR